MTDFLVVPDRDDLGGFRLPAVLRRALDVYARCYNGGRPADWPEHEAIAVAVVEHIGKILVDQQMQHAVDALAAELGTVGTWLPNDRPIPAAWPTELRRVLIAARRKEGWDEHGRRLGLPEDWDEEGPVLGGSAMDLTRRDNEP